MTEVRQVCSTLLIRYKELLEKHWYPDLPPDSKTNNKNLHWMCCHCLEQIEEFPLDKLNRWIGFIQGCLCCKGITTVDKERDFSRPLFHKAYIKEGINIPQTTEL